MHFTGATSLHERMHYVNGYLSIFLSLCFSNHVGELFVSCMPHLMLCVNTLSQTVFLYTLLQLRFLFRIDHITAGTCQGNI